MHIALLGTRGVPAHYSGFETCAEQLGQRLVERGHSVTVYCRTHATTYLSNEYKGMRLVKLPTLQNKYLETFLHTAISTFHALSQGYDIGLYFIAGNSPFTWIPRIVGTKTILNVDGLDWKRDKWPALAKRYLQFAEFLATKLPNCFVTDSRVVQDYYRERYGADSSYIAYGSDVEPVPPGKTLEKFGLQAHKYLLFVGRLVPENRAHHLVRAFRQLDTDLKLAIVGDSTYSPEYVSMLKQECSADERVVMTGYVFGSGYQELDSNALLFVETSAVGGTHPALVEAMAFGNCCVVNDTMENLETIGDAGISYDGSAGEEDLRKRLDGLLNHPELVAALAEKARQRAREVYGWDPVTDAYETLFKKLLGHAD